MMPATPFRSRNRNIIGGGGPPAHAAFGRATSPHRRACAIHVCVHPSPPETHFEKMTRSAAAWRGCRSPAVPTAFSLRRGRRRRLPYKVLAADLFVKPANATAKSLLRVHHAGRRWNFCEAFQGLFEVDRGRSIAPGRVKVGTLRKFVGGQKRSAPPLACRV